MASDKLERYNSKRDFAQSPEPAGELAAAAADGQLQFVVQKHAASRLHYDFRLELDGVMLSWAVPKGPSFDPKQKRLAVQTEDHPLSYNAFEGTIPKGHYGAGTVIVWDRGSWQPVGDPRAGLEAGKLLFTLDGHKLAGLWELVRIAKPGDKQIAWILFKKHDEFERRHDDFDVVSALPDSVVKKPPKSKPRPTGSAPGQAAATTARPADTKTSLPPKAKKARLPATLAPQLATLATAVPESSADIQWSFEIKFDGYRLLTRLGDGKPKLMTRGGHDWAAKMPQLARQLAALQIDNAWLDGEIVVLDRDGVPSFSALQQAFDGTASVEIVYFVFDLPYYAGHDLRQVELRHRRALLQQVLQQAQPAGNRADEPAIRFSADFAGEPRDILASACAMKLEGLIAKRSDAPYVSTRAPTWLKLKCRQRQEFVIAGFTDRGNKAEAPEIGSLLLGVHQDGKLISVGSVGTGWSSKTAAELKRRLLKIEQPAPAFAATADGPAAAKKSRWSKRPAGAERWVKPLLVAEVNFAEWTSDGQIRHASFDALRSDKKAQEIVREAAMAPPRPAATNRAKGPSMKITHPERVIDSSSGLTKLDLVRYYESVAEWMLPHLKGRPCSLVRGPAGIGGELFFQKHAEKLNIKGLKLLDRALMPEHEPLMELPNVSALVGAAQMNVIEIHTWNALARRFDKPDRIVFDLDPGEGVAWKKVQESAELVHSMLDDLGLQAWLKTSGGKGLHVVVPLSPRLDWDSVKDFSRAVVQHIASVIPDRFVAKSGPSNRVGKIFIDYLRNSQGATTVAAFSARARPGLGVSMPVAWDQLGELKSGAHWTIATAREYLSFQSEDPWAGYWKSRQTLTKAMKRL